MPGQSSRIESIERTWSEKGFSKYFTITSSSKVGLPTTYASEVYIAALELTHRQGFSSRVVYATKLDFIKLMGWHDNGQYRKKLITCFNELLSVKIFTNMFWDHNERKRLQSAERGFGIIDDFVFYDDTQMKRKVVHGEKVDPISFFRWNEVLFNSFQAGYIRKLDTQTYFSLRLPIAKTLFRYAGKVTYKNHRYESDILKFAFNKLLMSSNYKQPSKVIAKLQPSIKELAEKAPWLKISIEKGKTVPSGYKIIIQAQHETLIDTQKALSHPSNPKHDPLVQRLIDIGISNTKSTGPSTLIEEFGQSKIEEVLSACDYIRKQGKPLPTPGEIVNSLRNGYIPQAYYEVRDEKNEADELIFLKRNFMDIWKKRRAEIETQVREWTELPPESRINFDKFEAMERTLKKLRKDKYSEEGISKRLQGLIQEIPSFEEKLESELDEARKQIIGEAYDEGLKLNSTDLP